MHPSWMMGVVVVLKSKTTNRYPHPPSYRQLHAHWPPRSDKVWYTNNWHGWLDWTLATQHSGLVEGNIRIGRELLRYEIILTKH